MDKAVCYARTEPASWVVLLLRTSVDLSFPGPEYAVFRSMGLNSKSV